MTGRRRFPCLGRTALLLAVLAGCGREPVVRLADHARHQRDHVTTRWLPASSELADRLIADGWRIEEKADGAAMRMTGDRSRLWFYSADGRTTGAELHRAAATAAGPTLGITYGLNGRSQGRLSWRPEDAVGLLSFATGAARAGWNALDVRLVLPGEAGSGTLELAGIRLLDGREAAVADPGPRRLAVDGGELGIPGEGVLEVALEVPPEGWLELDALGEHESRRSAALAVAVELMDAAGEWRQLGGMRLESGDRDRLRVDLDSWVGRPVVLRLRVDGPRGSVARFRRAGVFGAGPPRGAEVPILPAPVVPTARLGRPDVVIVVLDAARADAFGVYGAEHPTPAVDALAASGTRFERALAPSSWTGQSIPALLTGFHPDTLHVERWGDPLPEEIPSLAELMALAGYRTVLWSQHPIYDRAESLVRGFEHVHYSGRRRRAKLPPRDFLFESERPTFALVHLLPPHSPYSPPAPFRGAYTGGYEGKLRSGLGALGRIGRRRLLELTPEDRVYIRGRYLENVAFADRLVERIVRTLTAAGRFDRSLILVTSDHGEAFLEHGVFMHSRELHQEMLRVPLVVKWPAQVEGFAPEVDEPATLIDLAPTLVDGLGLSAERGFQGRSLLSRVFEGIPLERPIYATTRGLGDVGRLARPRWLLEQGSWRVIHDPVADRTELYAAASDPGDVDDRSAERPAQARLLLQALRIQRAFNLELLGLGPRAEAELDPELAEELRALGYL